MNKTGIEIGGIQVIEKEKAGMELAGTSGHVGTYLHGKGQ